ncbi:hypothetical protein BAU17_00050 [Enterococcus sp. CU12B]|uniref:Uncharacterized protein n=1 Tax=Candidatus Enterococcus willemsii TaxID=1857215 RepID=A0ABQ6Z2C2_9ENTE|nr:hypothetical protein BAU17_00050 [Enterococcus sp. CU12B]
MGYVVLILTVICLVIASWKRLAQVRRFRYQSKEGYYLLVHKFEKSGRYFGVFQQGEVELTLQMPINTYIQLQPPIRGYLQHTDGELQRFEV